MNTRARILVADDDAQFRQIVVRLLEREGYVVEQAAGAPEALARLEQSAFDLLVADVHMPGNHALAVVRRQDLVPVLIVTGEPSVETAVAALRGSAVDYLAKPLSPERFLQRVSDGVARGRAMRRLRDAEAQLREQLEVVVGLRESLAVAGGHLPALAPTDAKPALPRSITELLSPREVEVLAVFREAPRPTEVASQLHISPHTVKNHFRSIYRKLGVSSQAELLTRLAEAQRS